MSTSRRSSRRASSGSPDNKRSTSRNRSSSRTRFMDNIKQVLKQEKKTEDEDEDAVRVYGVDEVSNLLKVQSKTMAEINHPPDKPPLSSELKKPPKQQEKEITEQLRTKPNFVALYTDGRIHIDPPTNAEVLVSASGQFIMDSGCMSGSKPVYHVVEVHDGIVWMQDFGFGAKRYLPNNEVSQRIIREIYKIQQSVQQNKKEKEELPNKQLDYLVQTMQQLGKKLEHLEDKITRTVDSDDEEKESPRKSILKKQERKGKNRKHASSTSESDDEEKELPPRKARASILKKKKRKRRSRKYESSSSESEDEETPFILTSGDWMASWISEGRPKLKVKIKDMGKLLNLHSGALKLLKEGCKEYNERLKTLTEKGSETFSLNNLARLCRNFMIRFGVHTDLFPQVFVEFCLPANIRSLAINNSSILAEGEVAFLTWISSRTLNQGSEVRLKRIIKDYIEKCLKNNGNVAQMISNLQGVLIPELLSSSNILGWTSATPEARTNQAEREARNFLLDCLEKHQPNCFQFMGMNGDIQGDLTTLGQKVESFMSFSKAKPKMAANVTTPGTTGEEDIMKKILDLESGKKHRMTKNQKFLELRKKCVHHKGEVDKCKEAGNHCFLHSITSLVKFPCSQCPEWLQSLYKKN